MFLNVAAKFQHKRDRLNGGGSTNHVSLVSVLNKANIG
jgi:hypothetical protein